MATQINFNHSAGVPVDERVLKVMKPYFRQYYGNPSSVHAVGQQSAKAIANARVQVGQLIAAGPKDHIIFTSGATEANNLALQDPVIARKPPMPTRVGAEMPRGVTRLRRRASRM